MPNGHPDDTGCRLHFGLVVLVALAVLTWFLGWWVPLGVAVLIGGAALYGFIEKRRRPLPHHGHKPHPRPDHEPDDPDDPCRPLPPPGAPCPDCGQAVFAVTPGVTTREEIAAFAAGSRAWRDNPEAREGWMPPGLWCPEGCTAIHSTPPG